MKVDQFLQEQDTLQRVLNKPNLTRKIEIYYYQKLQVLSRFLIWKFYVMMLYVGMDHLSDLLKKTYTIMLCLEVLIKLQQKNY